MIHKDKVENYNGTMEQLSEDIGNLKYDSLSYFLSLLSNKLKEDSTKDKLNNRNKLSNCLEMASDLIDDTKLMIDGAWKHSKPYMK